MIHISTLIIPSMLSMQTRREGADEDTDESWSSPDSSDEEEGGPDHVQCMSSWAPHTSIHMHTYIYTVHTLSPLKWCTWAIIETLMSHWLLHTNIYVNKLLKRSCLAPGFLVTCATGDCNTSRIIICFFLLLEMCTEVWWALPLKPFGGPCLPPVHCCSLHRPGKSVWQRVPPSLGNL